jgi:midasin (ATPase involved in ribosome maturation)
MEKERGLRGVVWTKSMKRLFSLSSLSLHHTEPLLLVGETGCGKTTVAQYYAMIHNLRLRTINCHANTDSSDLLGSLRPIRGKDAITVKIVTLMLEILDRIESERDSSHQVDMESQNKVREIVRAKDMSADSLSHLEHFVLHIRKFEEFK